VKFALRPLVFGSTNTVESPSVCAWRPSATGPLCSGNIARKTVTPTSATTRGRNRRTFASRRFRPPAYSCGSSVSIPGVARLTMLVMPKPHSGSLSSSLKVMRSGTRRDW